MRSYVPVRGGPDLVTIGATTRATEGFAPQLLAVALYEGESPQDLGEDAARVVPDGDFSGKMGETALLYPKGAVAAERLLLIGLGERDSFTREKLRRTAATVARKARSLKLDEAAFVLPTPEGSDVEEAASAAAEGATLGLYRFTRHRSDNDENTTVLESLELILDDPSDQEAASRGAATGSKLADAAILARDLANEPSNVATPEYLAQTAREIAERHGMGITVLDRAGIEEVGLTGLATVGRSAVNEPRFLVLEHREGGDTAPIVLVGKAVTFDSGGISIKPSSGMENMKFDMSGGACVLALGDHASGLMGNDEDLVAELQAAGETAGEKAWPLPLFEEYTEQIRGDTADIKNSGGRGGGALTAGAFLKEFADFPWAHLDIAGTAYGKKGNPYTTKGATGVPARLLVEFLLGRTR